MAHAHGVVFPDITLADVVVWQDDCVKVYPGPVDRAIIGKMEGADYDQAVVAEMVGGEDMPPFESPVGLVSRDRLEELADEGSALDLVDPAISKNDIELDEEGAISLGRVLNALRVAEAAMASWPAYPEPGPASFGILTRSDLNRHEFRGKLYPMLAELEVRMAKLLRTYATDPWDWLGHLTPSIQVRILGSWELATKHKKQPDDGPIAFAMLHELIRAAGESPTLAEKMGDAFRASCAKCSWDVDDLRNRVMHLVRPLIIDSEDVEKMKSTLGTVLSLTAQIRNHFVPAAGGR